MIRDVRTHDTRFKPHHITLLIQRNPLFFGFERIRLVNFGLRKKRERESSCNMVRAPYFDENGTKKGAWSEEEDKRLISYIDKHGHPNWRQLPKYAGMKFATKQLRAIELQRLDSVFY